MNQLKNVFLLMCIFTLFTSYVQSGEKDMSLNLKKGQVLTIAAPIPKLDETGKAAINEYYQSVIPLAQQLGLKREVQVKVENTAIGEFKPKGMVFFSWPSVQAEKALYAHSQWPKFKALRPVGWEELRLYTVELPQDLNLTFKQDKYYTLAVASFNPKKPNDYDTYLNNITDLVAQVGGRFIFKMHSPRYENHVDKGVVPDQLTFVEWDSADGLAKLRELPEYQKHFPLLQTGITGFEFHQIGV